MGKEKLKEMGELQEIIDRGDWDVHDNEDIKWVIDYAKEQAERVRELERRNKQLKHNLSVVQGYYKNMIKINKDTVSENNLYRKALQNVRHELNYSTSADTETMRALNIIDDILDGVSND